MANRYLKTPQTFQTGETVVHMKVAIGATGAPTLTTTGGVSLGIASISRTAAGDYTITLDDSYNHLLGAHVIMLEADDTDLQIQLASESVSTAGGGTIAIICTAAATAADPPDGSTLIGTFYLKNSSVNN